MKYLRRMATALGLASATSTAMAQSPTAPIIDNTTSAVAQSLAQARFGQSILTP